MEVFWNLHEKGLDKDPVGWADDDRLSWRCRKILVGTIFLVVAARRDACGGVVILRLKPPEGRGSRKLNGAITVEWKGLILLYFESDLPPPSNRRAVSASHSFHRPYEVKRFPLACPVCDCRLQQLRQSVSYFGSPDISKPDSRGCNMRTLGLLAVCAIYIPYRMFASWWTRLHPGFRISRGVSF